MKSAPRRGVIKALHISFGGRGEGFWAQLHGSARLSSQRIIAQSKTRRTLKSEDEADVAAWYLWRGKLPCNLVLQILISAKSTDNSIIVREVPVSGVIQDSLIKTPSLHGEVRRVDALHDTTDLALSHLGAIDCSSTAE